MADIAILIAADRNTPGLRRLLGALDGLETRHHVSVIVAETAPDTAHPLGGANHGVCMEIERSGYRWPIAARSVYEHNIARIRNALLATAFEISAPVFVVFLTDCDLPNRHWLDNLVNAQRKTSADIVGAPIVAEFDHAPPKWIGAAGGFDTPVLTDGPKRLLPGIENTLLRSSLFTDRTKPWFHPHEALVGATDPLFLAQQAQKDTRLAWCNAASIRRQVGENQTQTCAMLKAAREQGRTHALLSFCGRAPTWPTRICRGKAWLMLAAGGLIAAFGIWHRGYRFRGRRLVAIAIGNLSTRIAPRTSAYP